jgi:predicted DNA-binding transcriptional regulator AlpA
LRRQISAQERQRRERQRQQESQRQQSLSGFAAHPYRLYRVRRLAELLDVDRATIWRWRLAGVLPEPVQVGGVKGWTEAQVAHVLEQRGAATGQEAS